MKFKDAINFKSLFTRKVRFTDILEFNFIVNTIVKPGWTAFGNATGRGIIKTLSEITMPQYNTAYFIRNKKGYQTTTFQQAYDIVVTDKNGVIIKTDIEVKPGFISKKIDNAYYIYYLPIGSILHFNLEAKGQLNVSRKWF